MAYLALFGKRQKRVIARDGAFGRVERRVVEGNSGRRRGRGSPPAGKHTGGRIGRIPEARGRETTEWPLEGVGGAAAKGRVVSGRRGWLVRRARSSSSGGGVDGGGGSSLG
jgi:hypothetical protein